MGSFQFGLLSLSKSNNELTLLGLKVVSLCPHILRPLGEFLFKACNRIYFVEVVEDFGLYLSFADLAFTDPKKPFFAVIAFEQLHSYKGVARVGRELQVLSGQLARVFTENNHVANLTLRVNFELGSNVAHSRSFSLFDLFFELVKLGFRWLNHVLILVFFVNRIILLVAALL